MPNQPDVLILMTDQHNPYCLGYAGDPIVRNSLDKSSLLIKERSLFHQIPQKTPYVTHSLVSQTRRAFERAIGNPQPITISTIALKRISMAITDALPDMKRELKFYPTKNENPKKLTREQIQHFNKKGYIFPLDVFSPEEAEANRAYFDKLMAEAQAAGKNSYSINGWHHSCQSIYDLLIDERILDYVEDLLGPNTVSRMTHFFSKISGDKKKVAWHQDASYWPLTPSKTVTVWLAIDDVDLENAPMEVIPGSHLHGQIPFDKSTPEENNVLGQSVHQASQFGDPIPLVMKAGQISIHSDLLLHGSKPNTSDRRRCGLTLRYMPPEVRTRETNTAPAVICRGTDPSGYWQHIPRPDGDEMPARK